MDLFKTQDGKKKSKKLDMKKIIFIAITSLAIGLTNNAFAQSEIAADSTTNLEVVNDPVTMLENSAIAFSISDKDALTNATKTEVMAALFGKISGLNVTQANGFSYSRNPGFTLQGFAPLVLVDGVPRDINNITVDEVEDVIVYKDAVAAAIYGVRGGRGVVNIITKKGRNQQKLQMEASYQFGVAPKFRSPEFADSYIYGKSLNTALVADGLTERYSALELEAFRDGTYPEYANVDWYNESFNNYELNHQFSFNVRGGKEKFDYFALISYSRNEGLFEHSNEDERYDNQLLDTRLTLRTNIRVDVTKTTEFRANLQAKLNEYNGPNVLDQIITSVYKTPSAAFPIKSDNTWGGDNIYTDRNPVALLSQNGHFKRVINSLNLDISLTQDLSMITDGLSATALYAIDNRGSLYEQSHLDYQYTDLNPSLLANGSLLTNPIVYGKNSQTLWHGSGIDGTYFNNYLNTSVNYKKSWGENQLDANLIYNMQSNQVTGQNESRLRQSITGYASYNYNKKYFIDLVFSYAGASAIQLGDRFDLYPAVSGAWLISDEDFFQSDFINHLKVKGSFGYSAYDASIAYDLEKSYYTSGKDGYTATGTTGGLISKGGWGESDLPTIDLQLEKMRKTTFGAELSLFDSKLSFSTDAFLNKRYNVLTATSSTTSSVLGLSSNKQNDGIYNYKGFDFALGWNDKIEDFSYELGAIFSFTRSEIVENNEGYKPYDYLSRKGNSVSQVYGLEADGFFENQTDINNSPVQTFHTVRPGDIKYKDQNGDNTIDNNDVVRMFAPTMPEIYYGFDIKLNYKKISLYANFQGVGNYSIDLQNSSLYKPLVNNYSISNTFLENEVFWTSQNSSSATMPRLTTLSNDNNYRASSHWYRNAAYLKLRDLRVAYSFENPVKSVPFVEVYLAASNLFSIDNIGFADPESISDNYPSLRSFWAGLNVKF